MEVSRKVIGGVAKVTAVKTGTRCLVVLGGNGYPLWISNPNDLPEGTRISKSYDELQEMFPGAEIILHTKPKKSKVQAYNPDHAARAEQEFAKDVQAVKERGGFVKEGSDGPVAPAGEQPSVPSQDVASLFPNRINESAAQEKFLNYLNLQFAKWSVATGKQKKDISAEISAVAEAVLHVWPELEGRLVDLKNAATKPRFTLE